MIARGWPRGLSTLLACALLAAAATRASGAEKSRAANDPDLLMREQMVVISRQLGVTCTHCHDPNDYKSRKMKTWGLAKEHIRVVHWLNSKEGFGAKNQVDCYMCHRGEARPPAREPLLKELGGAPKAATETR